MRNVYDILQERGFIEQCTHEEEIKELLGKEKMTFYVGIDPTADSLHIGHFIPVLAMMHMQRAGHRPIALVGGGTAKVGDPSGKTELREMYSEEVLDNNAEKIEKQLRKFIEIGEGSGIFENNANWLDNLNYISFLREIGSKFSVNRMLTAEAFKQRMERGLSFIEFNYMIMQAYDFLELNRRHGCTLQVGGSDQWSNILAGSELIRRMENKQAYGLTVKLLVTSDGRKMGKTEKGAVWLDAEKTSPFDLFQYLRNVDDADVEKLLKLLTFLELDKIEELTREGGSALNKAKEVLAYEFTKLIHGEIEANKALDAAKSLFGAGSDLTNAPTVTISRQKHEEGLPVVDMLLETGIVATKSEGRRLIDQNGLSIDDVKVSGFSATTKDFDFEKGYILVKKGKKNFFKVELE